MRYDIVGLVVVRAILIVGLIAFGSLVGSIIAGIR